MNTNNTPTTPTTSATATPERIAADIRENITPSELGRSWSWRLTRADMIADALNRINGERERLLLALKVLEAQEVSDIFTEFDGKIINKRIWDALARACEIVAPVGAPWTNAIGQKCQPCAKIIRGDEYRFGAIYIPGYSDSVTIYRRWNDYTPETRDDEYTPKTGERLDAAKACAIFDYTAKQIRAKLDRIAADLERLPLAVSEYIRAAALLEDTCEGLTSDVREAFKIGSHDTLPVYIHN